MHEDYKQVFESALNYNLEMLQIVDNAEAGAVQGKITAPQRRKLESMIKSTRKAIRAGEALNNEQLVTLHSCVVLAHFGNQKKLEALQKSVEFWNIHIMPFFTELKQDMTPEEKLTKFNEHFTEPIT